MTSPPKKYLYHYHSMRQGEPGIIQNYDGTIHRDKPIESPDEYNFVRQGIANEMGVPDGRITVVSLTLLNP